MKRTLVAALAAMTLAGCSNITVKGSGDTVSVQHDINAVTEVVVKGNGQLILSNGKTPGLTVNAQREIHEHLLIEQTGNRLLIKPKEGYRFRSDQPIQYRLVMNDLSAIKLSGAVNLTSEQYATNQLSLDASGASDVDMTIEAEQIFLSASGAFDGYLSGQTNRLDLSFSGAADLNAFDLLANAVQLSISGAGTAYVTALETLDVSTSGASRVEYKGTPRVSQRTSGAGRVVAVE